MWLFETLINVSLIDGFNDLQRLGKHFHLYFVEAKPLLNDRNDLTIIHVLNCSIHTHDLCLDQNHDPLEIIKNQQMDQCHISHPFQIRCT